MRCPTRPEDRPPRYRATPDATPDQGPRSSPLCFFVPCQLRIKPVGGNSHAASSKFAPPPRLPVTPCRPLGALWQANHLWLAEAVGGRLRPVAPPRPQDERPNPRQPLS